MVLPMGILWWAGNWYASNVFLRASFEPVEPTAALWATVQSLLHPGR